LQSSSQSIRSRCRRVKSAVTVCLLSVRSANFHSVEDSSRTVSHLVRHHSDLYTVSNPVVWFQQFSTVPACSLRPSRTVCNAHSTAAVFQSSTMSNSIDQLYEVQQCRTPSTTANFTMMPAVNNVELHRQPHCMPSPAMSNSIDESYRHNGASSQQCRTPSTVQSAMSNSIDASQQCRTPSTIQDDTSSVQS